MRGAEGSFGQCPKVPGAGNDFENLGNFVDTSIACRSLGVGPGDLMNDLESFGLFFEDFAVRDLRVYVDRRGWCIQARGRGVCGSRSWWPALRCRTRR